jgi:Fe2+ or Zn2+ uptake regulation protein
MAKETRQTKQKRMLEDMLQGLDTFFTAEDLLEYAQKKDEKIGIATVYRFLKHKSKRDEIHSYNCGRRQVYSTNKNSHCHFICTKCMHVSHLEINDIDFLRKNAAGKICHFQIDLKGICNKCGKK